MAKFKKPFLFTLSLLPIAVVAGIFVGLYQLNTYPKDVLAQAVSELGSTAVLIAIGAVQTVAYTLFCGFFGYILANKIGFWKPITFHKHSLYITLVISVIGGILFSLDHWIFGSTIDGIQAANIAGLNAVGVIATVLYGGVIEEVMIRLFFMSLIAYSLWKIFYRKYAPENIPAGVQIAANVIAAVAFAAGHLPATHMLFGGFTPLILIRCFLLNGCFGLVFGWLYRKHGILYAMLSHALFHVVCKGIWFLFI